MYTLDIIKNEIKQLVATVVLVGTSPGLYLVAGPLRYYSQSGSIRFNYKLQ